MRQTTEDHVNGLAAVVLPDWNALAELAQASAGQRWIFRGESGEHEYLRPKAGRTDGDRPGVKGIPSADREIKALAEYRKRARPYIRHEPQNDLEWLAIAQHHGMHTRLLDWTESLLVAAYFATADAGARDKSGIILGMSRLNEATEKDEEDPFSCTNVSLYRPPHITPRIPAQGSVFTLHPNPTENFCPTEPKLTKWYIPADQCAPIKRILDAAGINEASLMPDIDGLSRYIGWLYKWDHL